jgi:hypothetical protein
MANGLSPADSSKPPVTAFILVAAALVLSSLLALVRRESQAAPAWATATGVGPAVYSPDPDDAWNRIFSSLFTRTVKARLSSELTEGAPFARTEYSQFPHEMSVSTRTFERVETGDRAVEPLYPSFLSAAGVTQVLSEPLYTQLRQALEDALAEKTARPPLDRALMQTDAWAAYDLLYRNASFGGASDQQLRERRGQLLPLLARFVRKLALTRGEIGALPDNYAAASVRNNLPALFDPASGWLEIEWRPERSHDHAADYRRAARVFVKPASQPRDKQEFLDSLRDATDIASKVDGLALVIQNLLIDSDGEVVPSRLTYDVQIRRTVRDARGAFVRTDVEEYELSRRMLLTGAASGGLVGADERAAAYLPAAGNDYSFASAQFGRRTSESPVLSTLRARCVACHAQDVAVVFTFSAIQPQPSLPVTRLNPQGDERALFVARRKMTREDFRALEDQAR